MINEEVGLPLERDAEGENLYILPRIFEENVEDLGIFILTDGNNRARATEGKGYNEGGKNVVKIAESLAERQDVSLMVACILSPENIRKRSDEFFYDMYKAFIGLGVKMETDGTLTNANIRLEVHGGLQALRERGGYALKLADMIEAVVAKTAHITDPSLRLLFGVDYDADTALDLGIHAIFRSGMEDSSSLRLSGTRSCEGIANYGSTKLWPDITAEDVSDVIDDAKTRMARTFDIGYSPDFIVKMIEAEHRAPSDKPFQATMTARASMPELLKMLDDFYAQNPDMLHTLRVIVLDKEGRSHREFGSHNGVAKKLRILPGSHHKKTDVHDGGYKAILAPGQYESREFVLPDYPEIGYANVHKCEATPEGVVAGIRHAISFAQDNVSLKGAERQISPQEGSHDTHHIPEYAHFKKIMGIIESGVKLHAEELAIHCFGGKVDGRDTFNQVADAFTAKMFLWAKENGLPLKYDFQFRAAMNYFLTSFFLVYYPDHPNWQNYSSTWEKDAEWLAKYMGIVYLTDESIFDIELNDELPEARRVRLRQSSAYIQRVILEGYDHAGPIPDVRQKDILQSIALNWDQFLQYFEEHAHPTLLSTWKTSLAQLYQSHANEWEMQSMRNPLVAEQSFSEIEEKYASRLPACIRTSMQLDMQKAKSGDTVTSNEGVHNLYLHTYLADINNSIGAGLAYRTIGLTADSQELDQETLSLLDDICTLSNFVFRMANDLSDFLSRDADDSDHKFDSFHIVQEKYLQSMSEADATLQSIIEIKERCHSLEEEIRSMMDQLGDKCPKVALGISRAAIARDIYSEGHYRTISRGKMTKLFAKHRMAGIV